VFSSGFSKEDPYLASKVTGDVQMFNFVMTFGDLKTEMESGIEIFINLRDI